MEKQFGENYINVKGTENDTIQLYGEQFPAIYTPGSHREFEEDEAWIIYDFLIGIILLITGVLLAFLIKYITDKQKEKDQNQEKYRIQRYLNIYRKSTNYRQFDAMEEGLEDEEELLQEEGKE